MRIIFQVLLIILTVQWGLAANGADLIQAPGFVEGLLGSYVTEGLALIIAWASYEVYLST